MIKSKATFKEKGKPERQDLAKKLRQMKTAYVTVGVHEDAGSYTGTGKNPEVYEVALWNEFGTRSIPSRTFMGTAIDENQTRINQWRDELIGKILDDGWSVEKALEALGLRVQILIQNKIKSNMPPPNAPSTVEAKRRKGVAPNTLQETKLLLRSITYKVYMS